VEFSGKLANRGELRSMLKPPGKDALLELLLQLHIEGDAAVGIEEEHGVILK
jgi:hypothetical protein